MCSENVIIFNAVNNLNANNHMKKVLFRISTFALSLVMILCLSQCKSSKQVAVQGYPSFEDGRVWIYSNGKSKVRTWDGVEADIKTDDIADYLKQYNKKLKTTRISLRYMDDINGLAQVQPLAEQLDSIGIKTAVALDNYMLDHMTMPEYRRAHIIDLGGGQYRFEMNCEKQEILQRPFGDEKHPSLDITGDIKLMAEWIQMFDGHGVAIYPSEMSWSHVQTMVQAANKRGIDQVVIVYEDSSESADISNLNALYRSYKGEIGPKTITLVPSEKQFQADGKENALDVIKRYNATYTTDWFDKGIRIKNPKSHYNRNNSWLHITNVVRTKDETLIMFYSFQGNDLWITAMSDITMRAGGKEYKEIRHEGFNGFEQKYYWSPDNGYYYFTLHFPAIDDDIETVDLVDAEDGALCISGLQVSDHVTADSELITMLLYGTTTLTTTYLHKDVPNIVTPQSADLDKEKTTVYMAMQIMEPHSVKGHVGNEFTLTFADGSQLKSLRVEGVKTNEDFDRGGDHVSTFFQVIFPASKARDWMNSGKVTLEGTVMHEPISIPMTVAMQIPEGLDSQMIERLLMEQ